MKPNIDIRRAADALERATQAQPGDLDHVAYEELEAFVDGRLGVNDREVVQAHLDVCATCAEDVADLSAVRDAMQVQVPIVSTGRGSRRWMQIAAAVIAVIAIGALVRQRFGPGGAPDLQVQRADSTTKPAGPEGPALQPASAASLSAEEQALIDRVLAKGALEMPADVRALGAPVGTLLGPAASTSKLTPIGPTGTAVLSATPEFSWRALTGATSYSVAVYDERFTEVVRSEQVTTTAWTPSKPLPRGASLAWQVTAHTPAGDVLAPTPPQPEARFVVVPDATATTIASQRSRLADRPLELGVLLASAGLFTDAERQLTRAANDASAATAAQAKSLLASLKK